jgi:cell division protein FtsB
MTNIKTNIVVIALMALSAVMAGAYVYLYVSNNHLSERITELQGQKIALEEQVEKLAAEGEQLKAGNSK